MKKLAWTAFFLSLFLSVIAQTPISGVINQYEPVLELDDSDCLAKLTVADTTGFSQGMEVIIIQMQGATINESNTASFGTVSLGGAGLYEKNAVDSVAQGEIFLQYKLLHDYDVSGKVQVVTMPAYDNALITSKLTAQNWDGQTGGLLAFSVSNELTMNANIDVTGKGFRGGVAQTNLPNDCSWLFQQDDYYYNLNSWRGAAKGEGVAAFINGKEAGKGPQANGGGGGNDHNSGGGGGANVTFGAEGGENNEPSTFGCKGQHPGLGGRALPQLNERFYLGGGGGAGHGNNDNATNGGNGGGIVIMEVDMISTNGFHILANGESVTDGGGDGAGGGGGGGTLAVFIGSGVNLWLEAVGGNGGNIDNNNADRCHGPGGGGSGGLILGNFPSTQWIALEGGIAGVSSNSAACSDSSNGAQSGNDGVEVGIAQLNQGEEIMNDLNLESQPVAQEVCSGDTLVFFIDVSGNGDFQWQVDQGTGFNDLTDSSLYNGVNTSILNITGALANMSGWSYRCVVSNACDEMTSDEALLEVLPELEVNPDNQIAVFCEGDTEVFSIIAEGSGLQFQWQLDEGNGFVNLSNDATYNGTSTQFLEIINASSDLDSNYYQCVVTDTCGSDLIGGGLLLLVESIPEALFSYTVNGTTVSFANDSDYADAYFWDFGDNLGNSDQSDPEYTYAQNGTYLVRLIALNNCGADTLEIEILIDAEDLPEAAFNSDAVQGCAPLIVQFTDQSSGNIDNWNWSFPGGNPATSAEPNPTVIYETPGVYDVSLEVENQAGTDENTFTDYITVLPPLYASFTYTVNENEVDFVNTSQNGLNFQWDFGDGSAFSNEENPSHTYNQPGVYLVTLVITNTACGAAITRPVDVLFTTLNTPHSGNEIRVFPNPFDDFITIYSADASHILSIHLFDPTGRLVWSNLADESGQNQWDLTGLAPGIFLLQIQTEEAVFVKKVTKY